MDRKTADLILEALRMFCPKQVFVGRSLHLIYETELGFLCLILFRRQFERVPILCRGRLELLIPGWLEVRGTNLLSLGLQVYKYTLLWGLKYLNSSYFGASSI